MGKKIKTEHAGAKNGGGLWGGRKEAKEVSKSLRRQGDQQEIKQAEIDRDRKINELEKAHAKEMSEFKAKESEKFYDKLQETLKEITLNGDTNSKFAKELTLKMVENMGHQSVGVGVKVNHGEEPKQVTAGSEG